MRRVPELSRFELQVLRRLAALGEGSVRDLHDALPAAPSYSTVRKIVERLERKGAVERAGRRGAAWVYRPSGASSAIVRKEIRAFLERVFDGSARKLVAHLADMDELTVEDLRAVERRLAGAEEGPGDGEDAP